MNPSDESINIITDLESRQDAVLRQLDELDRQIESVLAKHLVVKPPQDSEVNDRAA